MNNDIIKILLLDCTTNGNIIWANGFDKTREITLEDVESIVPRHEKNRADQKFRTRARAEIFTPREVCKLQNDLICKPFEDDWKKFVDAKFLEITCGEAPYIVNRYDAATGKEIDIAERCGLLDRKLRIVNAETSTVADWIDFAIRAVKSVYGYEFQGDNLFLARRNILLTVEDFFAEKFSVKVRADFLMQVAEIVSWNFWQMDGLTNAPPFINANPQGSLFEQSAGKIFCEIMDWTIDKPVKFKDLFGGKRR